MDLFYSVLHNLVKSPIDLYKLLPVRELKVIAFILIVGTIIFIIDMELLITDYTHNLKELKEELKVLWIHLLHHYLSSFILFGWLFDSKIFLSIYLLVIVFMLFGFLLNGGKCFITMYVNKKLHIPHTKFNTCIRIFNVRKIFPQLNSYDFYSSVYLFLIIFAIYKLMFL
jgi:hypothetical protein